MIFRCQNRYLQAGVLLACAAALAGVLWFIWEARREGFESAEFWSSIRHVDWRWMAATAALMLLAYYGRALRWAVMIEPLCPHPHVWSLFKATTVGFTAVVLLGRPGELVRPYLIAQSERVPFASQLAAWLIERVYDILMVVGLFGFALAYLGRKGDDAPRAARLAMQTGGWVAGLGAVLCLLVLFALHRWSGDLHTRLSDVLKAVGVSVPPSLEEKLLALSDGLHAIRRLSSVIRLLAWSVLEWAIIAAGYITFFRAFPETAGFSLAQTLVYVGFVAFGSILQIPGIGGGIQVVSTVVLVEFFGLRLESATGISILVWAVAMLLVVPIGLAFALHDGIRLAKLKNIATEIKP
ncbi:MAG TPA: lysylphosphatidylglycerol synthase transmembrane domain-containing protein [Bryobacteraceae bacterium]|nr:lysylphosphatidylglycerol synthase transmembrane domain-containing protein [Bryobacteraceae bacterium]HPT25027.1 lysylphosphatidylglycerol synthase transmembrane domain-containing protein [Bryobacteraceae bacterium]